MTTEKQTFYCNSTDWYFARAYSDMSLSYKDFKQVNQRWYLTPLVVFAASAIGSIIHMHWIWVVGLLISFPLFLIRYQRNATAVYDELVEQFQFAAPMQQIPFISIDKEQLIGHFFRPDGSGSHYIKLNEIDSLAINTLSNDIQMMNLPVLINKKAKSIGAEVIPELRSDNSIYVLWVYSKHKVMRRNTIVIPKQWFNEETFALLLKTIEQRTGKTLELDHTHPIDIAVINYLQRYMPHLHK